MQLTIDTTTDSPVTLAAVADFLRGLTDAKGQHDATRRPVSAAQPMNIAPPACDAQPVVASNTGTDSPLPPSGDVSTMKDAPAVAIDSAAAGQPVEKKPSRKGKSKIGELETVRAYIDPNQIELPLPVPEAAPAAPLSLDDVRNALQVLTGKGGVSAGIALLGEFKANRVSELKPEDFAAFIARCNA